MSHLRENLFYKKLTISVYLFNATWSEIMTTLSVVVFLYLTSCPTIPSLFVPQLCVHQRMSMHILKYSKKQLMKKEILKNAFTKDFEA